MPALLLDVVPVRIFWMPAPSRLTDTLFDDVAFEKSRYSALVNTPVKADAVKLSDTLPVPVSTTVSVPAPPSTFERLRLDQSSFSTSLPVPPKTVSAPPLVASIVSLPAPPLI